MKVKADVQENQVIVAMNDKEATDISVALLVVVTLSAGHTPPDVLETIRDWSTQMARESEILGAVEELTSES